MNGLEGPAARKEIRAVRIQGRAPAVNERLDFLALKMTYWIPVR